MELEPKYWKCNCEGDPCYYVDMVNPDKDPRPIDFCPKDGEGSRWEEIDKLPESI